MIEINQIDFYNNFNSLCREVFNGETIKISNQKNESVIILSETEYNTLQKSKRNIEYLNMLERSMQEAKAGNIIIK